MFRAFIVNKKPELKFKVELTLNYAYVTYGKN